MMMPANYSAIAENEMVYVEGGANFLGLPKQLSTLSTNVINIVANSYVPSLLGATVGNLFRVDYQFGDMSRGVWSLVSGGPGTDLYKAGKKDSDYNYGSGSEGKYKASWLGGGMQIVGAIAAIAQLMNNDVKPLTSQKILTVTGAYY